jgi:uncharacterized protein (TIGR02145 family)
MMIACQKDDPSSIKDDGTLIPSNPTLKSGNPVATVSFGNLATVTFTGIEYTIEGNTTFNYTVVSKNKPALGHWEINILPAEPGKGVEKVIVTNCSEQFTQGKDGSLKKFDAILATKDWVKFDKSYSDNEARNVSFTLSGKWYPGKALGIAKGGNTYLLSEIIGPIQCQLPTVETIGFSELASTSVKVTGKVINDGGANILALGICWGLEELPTIDNNKSSEALTNEEFTSTIVGLNAGSVYYARAYATNAAGTAYGEQISFKPNDPNTGIFLDSRDNQEYPWIRIGDQIWMAKNLAYFTSISPVKQGSENEPICYVYQFDPQSGGNPLDAPNYRNYGILYNYAAAQSLCPEGWHLPADLEWQSLINYLGSKPGSKLKETGVEHWLAPNEDATNESGFKALPGGFRENSGRFVYLMNNAYFWTSTLFYGSNYFNRFLPSGAAGVWRDNGCNSLFGLSVRCIKD